MEELLKQYEESLDAVRERLAYLLENKKKLAEEGCATWYKRVYHLRAEENQLLRDIRMIHESMGEEKRKYQRHPKQRIMEEG